MLQQDNSIEILPINWWGPYILYSEINKNITKRLYEEGKKLTPRNDAKRNLASRIDRVRYYSDTQWIAEALLPYTNKWVDGWNKFSSENFRPNNASLASIWINFQKAGETNPEHTHGGADLSFVIYLKVPEAIKLEYENFNKNKTHTGNPPGSLSFKYGEYQPYTVGGRNICPREDSIIIFPSRLRHYVSAHECSETRVSVAGNIVFLD